MSKILVIEDEERVSEVIRAYLEKQGYEVYCENSGLKGIETFNRLNFNLVILDLMLPDIQGEEVCTAIREKSDVYIFMLTAKASLSDKVEGLNIGADEYLVKPVSPRELTARINALFRRINVTDNSKNLVFDKGNFCINYDKRNVIINGKKINLTANEFDILYVLAKNKGKVLSREQLIVNVFGLQFDGFDRTIDAHIKNIRKKIEPDSKNPKYIVTVFRVGYKFGGE